jgi:hypothetical protein
MRTRCRRALLALLASLALVAGLPVAAQESPAPPVLDEAAQAEFLLKAKVISSRPAGKGITGTSRLTLSDGRVTHDAGFQSIDERASLEDIRRGRKRAGEVRFVDTYHYNIAAYAIARLLGLGHMMPVTVERSWRGRRGSLTWWVDDYLMDEEERDAKGEQSPDPRELNRRRQRMFVFAALVRDMDRNKGNVIYTRDWRVIMIDFSRAFRLDHELRSPETLQTCDRQLLARLESLTGDAVKREVGTHLTSAEIEAVMARRTLLVEHFRALIRERGEERVLY